MIYWMKWIEKGRRLVVVEKEDLINLKKEVAEYLNTIDVDSYGLGKTDERLPLYLKMCIRNPDKHNLYELLSIKRFFYLFEKYDYRASEVRKFIALFEFLKFSGDKGAVEIKASPVQIFQFANIKGFYRKDGRRLINYALLFVPRKFGKTTETVAFMVDDLLFGDANSQCYAGANSYQQAQILFGELKNVLRRLDRKLRRFKINREEITHLGLTRTSKARCLASNPDNLDGLNASLGIYDELSNADSFGLKNVIDSSMGARLNPMSIAITTASDKRDSPFVELLNYYKQILRGELQNDHVFAHIFEPDVDDDESDPNTWRKVQPHMGITVNEDFYERELMVAQSSADKMKEFRNKLLNVFTKNEAKVWIDSRDIENMFYKAKGLERKQCVVTVDLSVSDDFSAVTYLFYIPDRNWRQNYCPFHSITEYFIPSETLRKHPNSEMYKRWVEQGHLNIIEGKVIDYEHLANHILQKPYVLKGLGYDPYKSKDFIKIFVGAGLEEYLYPIKQTYGEFTSYVEAMEIAVFNEQMTFDPNPITPYCFGNAIIDEDRLENRKPIKASVNDKIDGAITNVMGFWMMNNIKNK